MKNITLKYITGALVIIWMIIVFNFSNQPSNETQNTSGNFTEGIVNIISKIINISEPKKEDLVQKLNPYIRKFAHYSLYTIGGIFIIISVNQYKNFSEKNRIIFSLIIGITYSIFDEIHQYFIPGRACQIKDIYIDTLGILTGIIGTLIFIRLYKNNKNNKNNKGKI